MAKDPDHRYATTVELARRRPRVPIPQQPPIAPSPAQLPTTPDPARTRTADAAVTTPDAPHPLPTPDHRTWPAPPRTKPSQRPCSQPRDGEPPPEHHARRGHRGRGRRRGGIPVLAATVVSAHRAAHRPRLPPRCGGGQRRHRLRRRPRHNKVLELAGGASIQTGLPFTGLNKPGGVAVDSPAPSTSPTPTTTAC